MKHKGIVQLIKREPIPFILLISLPYILLMANRGGDFIAYLGAADLLRNHLDCYNVWMTYQGEKIGVQYGYSPVFAMLLIPLTFIPKYLVFTIFRCADVFFLYRIFRILFWQLGIDNSEKKNLWLFLTLLFSLRFILHNFEMCQVNILLLWLNIEGLFQLFFSRKTWIGSLLLALGISIKILPIVFVPYLLYRRKFTATAAIMLLLIVLLCIPSLAYSFDFNFHLLNEWWDIINPLNAKYNSLQNSGGPHMHGISALVSAYFIKNDNGDYQILFLDLMPTQVFWLINIIRLGFVALTLWVIRSIPFKSTTDKARIAFETAYLFLITPLIFPQQSKFAFVYMIPAVGVVFYSLLRNREVFFFIRTCLLILVFLLTTCTTDGIIGDRFNYYTECLKIVTIGTILLVPLLMLSRPETN